MEVFCIKTQKCMCIRTVWYVNVSFLNILIPEGTGCADERLRDRAREEARGASCERAANSRNGSGARAPGNRLSRDRLEQRISWARGRTEPISCEGSFILNILIFCLVLSWAAPQLGIQLLQYLAWFYTTVFFFPGIFYLIVFSRMLLSSADILLHSHPAAGLRGLSAVGAHPC